MISIHTFWLYVGCYYLLLSALAIWLGIKGIKETIKKVDEYQAQKEKEKNVGDAQPHSW